MGRDVALAISGDGDGPVTASCRCQRSMTLRGRLGAIAGAVVGDPDLGLDENVGPAESGAADRLADLALVAVSRRSVDKPVTGGQRGLDSGDRLIRRRLEDPERC